MPSAPFGRAPAAPSSGPAVGAPTPACLNCGAPLGGAYCAACGQQAVDLAAPTWRVVREAMADAADLDGRVVRTLRALAVPGRLTAEFLCGRRAPYLGPLKLALLAGAALTAVWTVTRGVDAHFYGLPPYGVSSVAYIQAVVRGSLAGAAAVAAAEWALGGGRGRMLDAGVFALHLVAALSLWAAGVIGVATGWKLAWGTEANAPAGAPPLAYLLFLPAVVAGAGYVVAAVRRVHGGAWWAAALRGVAFAAVGAAAVLAAVRLGA